jgi:energy-coupling factor transporter ATP-binding protein EcfA2
MLKARIKYDSRSPVIDQLWLPPRALFKLSGGEKKRVAFAAAVSVKPAVLALDEPTAGQDGFFRKVLLQGLRILQQEGTAPAFTKST